jgi:hypothetical protein
MLNLPNVLVGGQTWHWGIRINVWRAGQAGCTVRGGNGGATRAEGEVDQGATFYGSSGLFLA